MTMAMVVLTLENDVSTDHVYPGRFMATVLPSETPQHAFADMTAFNARLRNGDVPPGGIIVAGQNFGCGSSREQAASALKGHDLVIVARGFARIFLQNACNLGLPVVICPEVEASEGDDLEITPGRVVNRTTGRSFDVVPLPAARQAVIDAGGLIAYARQRLVERAAHETGGEVRPTSDPIRT
jgi:3-isopropylmalate/(R)-2-methylmalate dehydratase small subunit